MRDIRLQNDLFHFKNQFSDLNTGCTYVCQKQLYCDTRYITMDNIYDVETKFTEDSIRCAKLQEKK